MNNTDTQIMSSMESQPEHLNEQENETVPTLRYRDQTLPKSTKRPFFAMTPTPDESISEGFEKPWQGHFKSNSENLKPIESDVESRTAKSRKVFSMKLSSLLIWRHKNCNLKAVSATDALEPLFDDKKKLLDAVLSGKRGRC